MYEKGTYHPEAANIFAARLDTILSTPVSTQNIDTYAGDGLEQVIRLIDDVSESYEHQPTIGFPTDKETEDAALRYAGLPDIEQVLDHIAELSDEINSLDTIMAHALAVPTVITPPNTATAPGIRPGNGRFEQPQHRPLTKLVLLMLQKNFDVDVHNERELRLTNGTVLRSMLRKESYNMLEAPTLQRIILACDEAANATYVFDTTSLQDIGITNEILSALHKQELDALIRQYPGVGKRLVQSPQFPAELTSALEDLTPAESGITATDQKVELQLLRPDTANGRPTTVSSMAKEWNIHKATVTKAAASLREEFGQVEQRIFRGKFVDIFTDDQKLRIQAYLEANSMFSPTAPEDYLSASGIARELQLAGTTVAACIEELQDVLGDVGTYKFGARLTSGYSPTQQVLIRQALEAKGAIREQPPEMVLSTVGMAKNWGVDHGTITRAIRELQDELGTVHSYKFGPTVSAGYDAGQQSRIHGYLDQEGYFNTAPDDVQTARSLAEEWQISPEVVRKAVHQLKESGALGDVGSYRFSGNLAEGYTAVHRNLIRQAIEERGLFGPQAPEGVLSIAGMARVSEVGRTRIAKLIERLVEEGVMEPPLQYVFSSVSALGLTPDQQKIILSAAAAEDQLTPTAPEGILSLTGLGKVLNIEPATIKEYYRQMVEQGELPEAPNYLFRRIKSPGLDAASQQAIAHKIAETSSRNAVRKKAASYLLSILGQGE